MPRRNRRKLHRALRRRAEARKQLSCALRARRSVERQRAIDALIAANRRAALRSRAPCRAGVSSLQQGVGDLLALAEVSGVLKKRVHRICAVVEQTLPALSATQRLPWFLLLARSPWVRRPEAFGPPSGSLRRKRDALALHLFAEHPVPGFLLRSLDVDPLAVARVPVEDDWAVGLLSHVGRGRSLRALVGTAALPVPLTRRMCHLFLAARASTPPLLALRRAQVVGSGGPASLAQLLVQTRLGVLRGPDPLVGEPFWHTMIGWMARTPWIATLGAEPLERILTWMEARQRMLIDAGRGLSMRGRTAASLLREVEAWHAMRERQGRRDFPESGLLPLRSGALAITEIRSEVALSEEGAAMHHCASSYRKLLHKGKVALFSITEDGARAATVEVSLGAGRVVQAKAAFNRACSSSQLRFLRTWASRNRLEVAL